MAGIELTPILAGETKNPQKTFPLAILISAILVIAIYIIATISITLIISPDKIAASSGIMDAVRLITTDLNVGYLIPIVSFLIVLGGFAGISVWSVVPIKMFFESTKQGILPQYLTKLNKNDMPARTMILQSSVITIVVLVTSLMPSVNSFYEILVLMATITYFFPYLAMFCAFIKLRKKFPDKVRPYRLPGGKLTAIIAAALGFLSVSLAILLPFVFPPSDVITTHHSFVYRVELLVGPVLIFILGNVIYGTYVRRKKRNIAHQR
jgi:glutamate:GABA antiporter